MSLFERRQNKVPVWFMRQAGRYHSHYQAIRKRHNFMDMCKDPVLACEITMGPIQDFDFDAAILFSDLLFPLEHLGLGLDYDSGPPRLAQRLDTLDQVQSLQAIAPAEKFYLFQKAALQNIRRQLASEKTLLGFVGGPFTLYTYAVEGQHAGNLVNSKLGLYDGRFEAFVGKLLPSLLTEMRLQADGGADTICIFDTAAGELSVGDYRDFVAPILRSIAVMFKATNPAMQLLYYSKLTHLAHLEALNCPDFDALGIDWRFDLPTVFERLGENYFIQGNLDPAWLSLPWPSLESKIKEMWRSVPAIWRHKWIAGLGHGVLPQSREDNVRNFVRLWHQLGRSS